jgi:hypothetical protein
MTPYTIEQRWSHIRQFLDRQLSLGMLGRVRPGQVAGTYGGPFITKDDVKEEIRKRHEAGGAYDK